MDEGPTLQKCTHVIAVLNEHIQLGHEFKGKTIKNDEKGKQRKFCPGVANGDHGYELRRRFSNSRRPGRLFPRADDVALDQTMKCEGFLDFDTQRTRGFNMA